MGRNVTFHNNQSSTASKMYICIE